MDDFKKKLSLIASKMPPTKGLNARIASKRLSEEARERHNRRHKGSPRPSLADREKFYQHMKD